MKFLEEIKKYPSHVLFFAFSLLMMAVAVCHVLSFTWAARQDYSFGYMVPIFVLYVLYDRWSKISGYLLGTSHEAADLDSWKNSSFLRWLSNFFFGSMLFCGLLTFLFFATFYMLTKNKGAPAFGLTFAFSFTFLAMAYWSSGTDALGNRKSLSQRINFVKLFIFPCFIWIIAAPMINKVEEIISLWLLSIVADITYGTMDALGYMVTLRGNVIEFPNGSVGVADACSGIRSLVACIFAGSFLATVMLNKFWKKILLVGMSMVFAFLNNLLRAMFLAFWAYENGAESISGAVHDTAGYVILGMTVVELLILVSIFNINPVPSEFRNKTSSQLEDDGTSDSETEDGESNEGAENN